MSLVVRDLVSGYHPNVNIIEGVSLCAEKAKTTCVIGPNGAGKSTLLKTIYGFLDVRQGRIHYNEKDITGSKPYLMPSMQISYIPQERSIFPNLTVYENLRLSNWLFRKDKKKIEKSFEKAYEVFPVLKTKRKEKASSLSGGQQKMLEFSRALMTDSTLILVDEPTAGLAPIVAKEVYAILGRLKEEGTTILLVDQNVRQAIKLADYVYQLLFGKVQSEGPKKKFASELNDLIKSWI